MSKYNNKKLQKEKKVRVLVDMDGVLCDFEGQFLKEFREKFPEAPFVSLEERNTFYIDDQYSDFDSDIVSKTREIILAEGFFHRLPPIPGAIEAVKEMSGMPNVEVLICTSALTSWIDPDKHYSVKDKCEWVHRHMGCDWLRKMIITSDKTVIAGDILIDDKPCITGISSPSWKHVLFTSCHNKHLDCNKLACVGRLDNWTEGQWRTIIDQYIQTG